MSRFIAVRKAGSDFADAPHRPLRNVGAGDDQTNTRPLVSRSRIQLIAWGASRKQGQRSSSPRAQPTAHRLALVHVL